MEEAKYSLSLPLPKADQFDRSITVTIRGDHVEEFKNSIDAVLGEGTYTRLAAQAVSATWPREVAPAPAPAPLPQAAPAPAPQPLPQPTSDPLPPGVPAAQPQAQAPQVTYGPCPECRVGTLVLRNRRDGQGQFIGCNRYRRDGTGCGYIYNTS
jgi:hypothetical protein